MKKTLVFACLSLIVSCVVANVASGKSTTITLSDGTEIPVLGFGTALSGVTLPGTLQAVKNAIDIGYRHFDTATDYKTEECLGKALSEKINEGKIKRDDVYITTKLWNNDHAENQVVPALRLSLQKLQLEYVDQYLIHEPDSFDENDELNNIDYLETWRGMEEAHKLGLAKTIGVSNFNKTQLERLLQSAKIKPVVNQIEVSPSVGQKSLLKFCKENNVQVVAYTPVRSLFDKNPSSPAPKVDDPVLTEIGQKYNKTTAQVVLRYIIDSGLVAIIRSHNHMDEDIDIFDFKLTQDEIEKIDKFNLDQ